MAFSSSDKVREVYIEEKQNRDRIDEMKSNKRTTIKIDAMNNIPSEIISRVNEFARKFKALSPSNNNEALVLESKFVEEVKIK